MAVLMEFMKAQIAKTFPGYGQGEPFPGHVAKVDVRGTDDKPFKIHYDDGDKEWVTLAELVTILTDPDLKAKAQQFLYQGGPKDPEPPKAAAGGRKRTQPEAAPQAAPPAAGGTKKPRAAAAAAAVAEPPAPASAAARKAGKAHQQPAALDAAGVGLSGGSKPSWSSGKAAAGAAGAAAGAAGAAAGAAGAAAGAAGAAAGGDSAAVSPSEVDGLINDVCREADRHASADRWGKSAAAAYRHEYKGPGSTVLPKMSQGLITANQAFFTIYSSPRGTKTKSYRAEAEEVLRRLSEQLQKTTAHMRSKGIGGKLEKSSLTRVRVHLRDVQEGLPDFTAAWDAWVEPNSLPLLTILQGSGPWSDADIVLEADAYISPALT